jgi:hypothetical protein
VITLDAAYRRPVADAGPSDWLARLAAMGACRPALKWAAAGKFASWQACWDACPHGGWLLWLAGRLGSPSMELRSQIWRLNSRTRCEWDAAVDDCACNKAGAAEMRAAFPVAPALPEVRK